VDERALFRTKNQVPLAFLLFLDEDHDDAQNDTPIRFNFFFCINTRSLDSTTLAHLAIIELNCTFKSYPALFLL